MKNILKVIVVVLLIPLAFSACKDDEDSGASLVGTWTEVSFVASGCTDPADNENTTCTSSCEQIVISETQVNIDGLSIPYTVSGNTITITFGTDTETVTFTVTSTTLVITSMEDGCTNVSTYKRS